MANPSPGVGAPGRSDKILFWASFLTLIAAGIGFSIRGDILGDWGQQFGFTQSELGDITGSGLVGFGITIIVFSFFADRIGYGPLMVVAFLLHVSRRWSPSPPPPSSTPYGKDGAYWCLYVGHVPLLAGQRHLRGGHQPADGDAVPEGTRRTG